MKDAGLTDAKCQHRRSKTLGAKPCIDESCTLYGAAHKKL